MAHEFLFRYRQGALAEEQMPLLGVTFDMRGHGEREVSREANTTWKDGNESHA
jgi:hypothetical protein